VDLKALGALTLIVPYYRNRRMLERQVREWNGYPAGVQVVLVDDGSPEPALPIVNDFLDPHARSRVAVYRILEDVPWNREGARNLGAHVASTPWIVHVDIDHILPAIAAALLLRTQVDPRHWYRFHRWRVGAADATRRKDKIADQVEFGEIHPHVDSYLVRKGIYWEIGAYDEAFAGCLGGGSDFLRRLEARQAVQLLPPAIALHVHTRHSIPDASDWSLSRDTSEGKRRARMKRAGSMVPVPPLRFPWTRVL
jgi:hypothetical protein